MTPQQTIEEYKRANELLRETKIEQAKRIDGLITENRGLLELSTRLSRELTEVHCSCGLLQKYLNDHFGPEHVYACLTSREVKK